MKEIIADKNNISFCGLYCGACRKFLKGNCPGCQGNEKATWCKVRTCCMENKILSCADCKSFDNILECKKYNNFVSKIFSFIFRSDRNACNEMISRDGYEKFAEYMAENKLVSMKKK